MTLKCLTAIFTAITPKQALVGHCFMVQILGKTVCMTRQIFFEVTLAVGITTIRADHKIFQNGSILDTFPML